MTQVRFRLKKSVCFILYSPLHAWKKYQGLRTPKHYRQVVKQAFCPELTHCCTCHTRLRRVMTLSQRTIVTLAGPIQIIHRGYRCPSSQCPTARQVYRSAQAEALALPGFTFGMDIVARIAGRRFVLTWAWGRPEIGEDEIGLLAFCSVRSSHAYSNPSLFLHIFEEFLSGSILSSSWHLLSYWGSRFVSIPNECHFARISWDQKSWKGPSSWATVNGLHRNRAYPMKDRRSCMAYLKQHSR